MRMHDCARTKEQLIDLVFGEVPDAARLRAEVESCADCRAERHALTETLLAYDRATAAAEPTEDFWAGYHARLAARIIATGDGSAAAPRATPTPDPLDRTTARLSSRAARLRRALATSWRVPAPAAVAAALLFVCVSVFALVRPAPEPIAVESPALADPHVDVRTVEVPVVRERIVTRTVYVARGEGSRFNRPARGARVEEARGAERVRVGGEAKSPEARRGAGRGRVAELRGGAGGSAAAGAAR
ncbi:MAG: hypothetical protein LC785_08945 [Acidobacteria bacterium]|nr:hypothetical protein [Acidobacteriota bacterium]